jgi:hypothetical protein
MGETFSGLVKITGEAPLGPPTPRIILDGANGSIELTAPNGKRVMFLNPNTGVGGKFTHLFLGEIGAGIMAIRGEAGKDAMTLDGRTNSMALTDTDGRNSIIIDGAKSSLYMHHYAGNSSLTFDGAEPKIVVRNKAGVESITLDGELGDIRLRNRDCAEEFDIAKPEEIEPGTVMVVDNDGKLQRSNKEYDNKVVGVISGTANYKPGILLGKINSQNTTRMPLALVGTVSCKVDATYSEIEMGDMLTTSSTPGHAMKAIDPLKCFGTVIGKALGALKKGKGFIPVLVALQ